jgi:hypothetical protein
MNLTTIYIEVLPPYVHAGFSLHVTHGMSFDQVQRMAHNLGTSLRQTMSQVPAVNVIKTHVGTKALLAKGSSVQRVDGDAEIRKETVVADTEQMTLDGDAREIPVHAHAMWTTPQTSGRGSFSPSPPLSAVSFPTRSPPRTSPFKYAMCYLCYVGATSCFISHGCRLRWAARRHQTARPICINPRNGSCCRSGKLDRLPITPSHVAPVMSQDSLHFAE